jgi:hypothetical protein
MIKGFFNLPWLVWAGAAFLVAVVYFFVWPHKTGATTTGFRFFVIRWGHALTWLLLTINFILRGSSPSLSGIANIIALFGALMYVLFIALTYIVK